MRILFVRANQGYPDSRVEKELYSLAKVHHVELLGWDRTKYSPVIEDKTIIIGKKSFLYHWISIPAPQGQGFKKVAIPMMRFWLQVNAYLKKNYKNFDAVHFCDFDTAALSFEVAHKLGLRVVYDIFDYYADSHCAPGFLKNIIRKKENFIIEHSDVVILCNEKRLEQIYPAKPKKYAIIRNTPTPETGIIKISLKGERNMKRRRLVYVGMLSNDRYLREMAKVIAKRKDIEWHVAGFGYLETFFKELEKKYDNIYFYGKISYAEALGLESQCDIMTAFYDPNVPNHKYADPNKFYEALMLGKPIIVMEGTGINEFIKHYNIGEVIDIHKNNFSFQFNEKIDSLLELDNYKEIGARMQKIYHDQFSWSFMEKRLLEVYQWIKNST